MTLTDQILLLHAGFIVVVFILRTILDEYDRRKYKIDPNAQLPKAADKYYRNPE